MQSVKRFIYGPTKEERVREVQRKLRAEQRGLDREIRQIDQSIAKAKTEIRRLARKGDVQNSTVLAKEVVRSNKHKTKLTTSKALLNSISLQLQQQLCTRTQLTPAMLHVTGHLQSSTEIMKLSNRLIKIPQLSQSMREMSAELMKVCVATDAQAGILEEMMQDMLDTSVLNEDPDAMEEEAQAEVDEVLYDLTNGQASAPAAALPSVDPVAPVRDESDADHMEEMQAALHTLLQG